MNKKRFFIFMILLGMALIAFTQTTNKGSKGQQYILLDTLKDNRKPLYQRPYSCKELIRAGYKPIPYKGRVYMTWKRYLELVKRG